MLPTECWSCFITEQVIYNEVAFHHRIWEIECQVLLTREMSECNRKNGCNGKHKRKQNIETGCDKQVEVYIIINKYIRLKSFKLLNTISIGVGED